MILAAGSELFVGAMATIAVGVFSVFVAWRQASIAHHKLKMDLFDRRWTVFKAALSLFEAVEHDPNFSTGNLAIFREDILPSQFLFDENVLAFLAELQRQAERFAELEKLRIDSSDRTIESVDEDGAPVVIEIPALLKISDEKRSAAVNEKGEIALWFYKQKREQMGRIFRPSLNLQTIFNFDD